MLLDCLVDVGGDGAYKMAGDIIVAKLKGARWGNAETKVHQIIEFPPPGSDSEVVDWCDKIGEKLQARRNDGEVHPSIAYPFAEYTTDEDGTTQQISRAVYRIKLQELDDETLAQVQDASREVKKIPAIALKMESDPTGTDRRPDTDTETVSTPVKRPTAN